MIHSVKLIVGGTLIAVLMAITPLQAADKDVIVVNTPNVNVDSMPAVNVATMPEVVDVAVVSTSDVNVVSMPTPEETVVCFSNRFGGWNSDPYDSGQWSLDPRSAECPDGVSGINVQQIAIWVGGDAGRSVAKFRFTLAFGATTSFDPGGFLATLTDGMPSAAVAQPFILSPGVSRFRIGVKGDLFGGLADQPIQYFARLYFIGTPLPLN